jgi:hypothetical protein
MSVAVLTALGGTPAWAEPAGFPAAGLGQGIAEVVGLVADSALFAGGAVSLGFTAAKVGKGTKPSIAGYLLGALNCAAGAVLALAGRSTPAFIGIGIAQAAMGATDFGLTLWQRSRGVDTPYWLALSPTITPAAGGKTAFGVGVKLAAF